MDFAIAGTGLGLIGLLVVILFGHPDRARSLLGWLAVPL